jgi:tRNA/tmRNA/rRNA uracil-C5-methylase (TrmA/RlmC/RlmD family)
VTAVSEPEGLVEGDTVEVTVGAPAHGGHCVARLGGEHGRVVFVRHALPGERVTAEITEVHRGYLRADAVEVHEAAADRVTPPCAYAKPGLCGGCDLQHVSDAGQLDWKTAVVHEALTRLGGMSQEQIAGVRVRRLPGGLLGWRSRVRYTVDAADRPGLLKHRSHEVVAIDRCLIAHRHIQELDVLGRAWPDAAEIDVVAPALGPAVVVDGKGEVRESAAGREWTLPAEGFWQVHPAAADTLAGAVLELLDPQPGETAWDLYGGAGLFAAAVAGRTGARVSLVESAPESAAAARANLTGVVGGAGGSAPEGEGPAAGGPGGVEVIEAKVERALRRRRITGPVDLVVLDPPRSGAGAEVVRAIAAAGPRAVAYVACDPAALGRDIGTFAELGWAATEIRAYDCFPMTRHIECVALLTPAPSRPS